MIVLWSICLHWSIVQITIVLFKHFERLMLIFFCINRTWNIVIETIQQNISVNEMKIPMKLAVLTNNLKLCYCCSAFCWLMVNLTISRLSEYLFLNLRFHSFIVLTISTIVQLLELLQFYFERKFKFIELEKCTGILTKLMFLNKFKILQFQTI